MRILDLFCGGGGASAGYAAAGFEVVGVDVEYQPKYPFTFVEGDALELLALPYHYRAGYARFDAIHASPPCQFATDYGRTRIPKPSENLIPETRELLKATGLPWIMENVEKARPWLVDPTLICGSMFDPPMDIRRHRLFETNWDLEAPEWPCRHLLYETGRYPGASNRVGRQTVEVGVYRIPIGVQQAAMEIDWLELERLSEAIPPRYTRLIGDQLAAHLRRERAATLDDLRFSF